MLRVGNMLELVVNWFVANTVNVKETNMFSLFSNLFLLSLSCSFSYIPFFL